jgi:hypothetical protein
MRLDKKQLLFNLISSQDTILRMVMQNDGKRGWISILGTISGFFLDAILVIATIGKVADPVLFVEQIREEGLEILFSANTVAVIALTWETLVGLALLFGIRNYWVMIPTTALSASFLFLTGRTYYQVLTGQRQESYDCGCFGIFLQRTATEAFWQDLFILVPPIVIMLFDRWSLTRPLPTWRTLFSVLGTLILMVYTIGWAGLPETQPYHTAIPDDSQTASLEPSDQFEFFVGGSADPDAEIFGSDFVLKFVILSSKLSEKALIIDIQKTEVSLINLDAIVQNDNGSVTIQGEDTIESLGNFEIGAQGLSFKYQGKLLEMRSRL